MLQSRSTHLLAAATCAVLLGLWPGPAAAALSGNWGCLGTVTYSFVVPGQTQPQTLTRSLLMRLTITPNPTGGPETVVASGFFGFGGAEVCGFTNMQGQLAFGGMGLGTLTLTLRSVEEDGEASSLCPQMVGAPASPFTINFHLVTAKANTQFYFMGKDNFLTLSPPSDSASDRFAESGECTQQ